VVQAQEKIHRFEALITVATDGSLTITETIQIRAMGEIFKRGIVRNFPTTSTDPSSNKVRKHGFEILEITKNGTPEPWFTEESYHYTDIYIGQEDVLLTPNTDYIYTLTYRTTKQLRYFDDFDELYWNVNGNGWDLTFDSIRAIVVLPADAASQVLQYDAYTGYAGDQGKDFKVRQDENGNWIFETTRELQANEGLTIALAWPVGVVSRPTAEQLAAEQRWLNASVWVFRIGALLVFIYFAYVWVKVGVDPRKGAIMPVFTPPDQLSPASLRYVMRMGMDHQTMTSAILNVAVKGWLQIHKSGKFYELTRNAGDGAALSDDEQTVLRELLGSRSQLELKQKNHEILQSARQALKDKLDAQHLGVHFNQNFGYIGLGVGLSLLVTTLSLILMGLYVEVDPENMVMIGLTTLLGFGVLLFEVFLLRTILFHFRHGRWYQKIFALLLGGFSLGSIVVFILFMYLTIWPISPGIFASLMLIFLANGVFGSIMRAPTPQGRALMDHIEGFKMYLAAAEKDRLQFLHPPEQTPELFESYLPYALALNVENQWADQFTSVFEKIQDPQQHGYQPRFYQQPGSTFIPSVFAHDMGRSFTHGVQSASSSPSSSGSSGGGSSGGGGGGGGGGGW
jgi:uncharacterized membrane protein YgcG